DEEAIGAFERALAADSSLFEAHRRLGVLYRKQGKLDKAASALEAVVKSGRAVPADVHLELGRCHHALGKTQEALDAVRGVMQTDPNNIAALKFLGVLYAEL